LDRIYWLLPHIMAVVGFLCAIILVPRVIMEKRQAGATIAWVLAICLVPYVGVPLFFLVGGRRVKRLTRRKGTPARELRDGAARADLPLTERARNIADLMARAGASPPCRGNRIELVSDAQGAYDLTLDLLDGAETSIEAATYILGRDDVGRAIVDKLAEKAAQGVAVRLLVDGVGSFRTGGRFLDGLREHGGRSATFFPVVPLRRKASANLRNHRKITIVDDRTALIGGMNLSSAHMGPPTKGRRWTDVCMRIDGPSVLNVREVFDTDWTFATDEEPARPASGTVPGSGPDGSGIVQIVADGPDMADKPIYSGVMAALFQASGRIWIVSPYYVPDEAFAQALNLAARMGRDVRLILPQRSNMRLVDLAGRSYLDALLEAGAQVYLFQEGLLHAKLLVLDDILAGVGSFNADVRSFHLNFEIGAFLYDSESIARIADTVLGLQARSKRLDRGEFARRGRLTKFAEDTCRIFSPVL